MNNEQAWRYSLKAGDEVLLHGRWRQEICTVDRVTATQVIVGSQKFRKDSGYPVGRGNSWDRTHLREVTQADRDRLEIAELRGRIEKWAPKAIDLATLRAVANIIGADA